MQNALTTGLSALLGLMLGSFYNVCIYRIPEGKSIVWPPSHCTSCGHRLLGRDLVPIFSWLALGGKCRYCGAGISARYPLVEILTSALFVACRLRFGFNAELIMPLVMVSILIIASFIDIDHMIIPDELVILGGAAVAVYTFSPYGAGVISALLGASAGSLPLVAVYYLGLLIYKKEGMGGGDVKLMAVCGAYLGWKLSLFALFCAVILGAVGGIIVMRLSRGDGDGESGVEFPFGPFLATGTVCAMLFGESVLTWYLSLLL